MTVEGFGTLRKPQGPHKVQGLAFENHCTRLFHPAIFEQIIHKLHCTSFKTAINEKIISCAELAFVIVFQCRPFSNSLIFVIFANLDINPQNHKLHVEGHPGELFCILNSIITPEEVKECFVEIKTPYIIRQIAREHKKMHYGNNLVQEFSSFSCPKEPLSRSIDRRETPTDLGVDAIKQSRSLGASFMPTLGADQHIVVHQPTAQVFSNSCSPLGNFTRGAGTTEEISKPVEVHRGTQLHRSSYYTSSLNYEKQSQQKKHATSLKKEKKQQRDATRKYGHCCKEIK